MRTTQTACADAQCCRETDGRRRLYFEWQAEGLCLTTEPQAVPEVRAIDRMEQRVFAAVPPGEEIRYQRRLRKSQSVFRVEESRGCARQGHAVTRKVLSDLSGGTNRKLKGR